MNNREIAIYFDDLQPLSFKLANPETWKISVIFHITDHSNDISEKALGMRAKYILPGFPG